MTMSQAELQAAVVAELDQRVAMMAILANDLHGPEMVVGDEGRAIRQAIATLWRHYSRMVHAVEQLGWRAAPADVPASTSLHVH